MDANDKKTAPAVSASVSVATSDRDRAGAPEKKKKQKKGSSKATRRALDVEKKVGKALKRFAKATSTGVNKYDRKADKSNEKRRDGALLDMPQNAAQGASRAASDSTPAIGKIVKVFSTKKTRKAVRRNLRNVPAIPFM
jgi:hypothetical protein